jgi:DNA-directed RNA polymerase specialized sigma24 family protein
MATVLPKGVSINDLINTAIERALKAGREQKAAEVKDAFKATEKRLYALPTLMLKVEEDEAWIVDIQISGSHERSQSLVRFGTSGVRLSEDEIVEGLIIERRSRIVADEQEIQTMQRALGIVRDDEYYEIIPLKYFDKRSDDEIADELHCDASTVRRNKSRLIREMSVYLYGAVVVS